MRPPPGALGQLGSGPKAPPVKPKAKPPEPYELPDLAPAGSIYEKKAPTRDRVLRDADTGRRRWQARNDTIARQAAMYHQEDDPRDLNGNPIVPGTGQSYFKLARATTIIDRLIGDAMPTNANLVKDLPARADDKETRDAAQACENWLRTLDEEDTQWWASLSSQGVITPPLYRKRIGMPALEGTGGVAFRLNPKSKTHFVIKEPVNITELYPLGLATTRQSWLNWDEAVALYPEIHRHAVDKGYDDAQTSGPCSLAENTRVRVVGWSDKDGLWRCVVWDWADGSGVSQQLRDAPKGSDDDDGFIVKARIDYGFCYYQIGTYWNASPAAPTQSQTDYATQAGRGALAAHVGTLEELTKVASALKSNFIHNLHPSWVRKTQHPEEMDGDPIKTGINEVNDLEIGDELLPLYQNATGTPDGQATMQILGGELQDMAAPVLSGGGTAQSGFDRSQMQQAAGNLHLDQLKECYQQDAARFDSLTLQLALRKGLGKGKAWKKLTYRQFKGGAAGTEGALTPDDIKRAGVRVLVSYHEENLQEELQKNQIHLERLKADVQSLMTTRKKLGVEDPDREGELVVEDKIINANPKLQDALSQRALYGLDYELYADYMQSEAPGPGQAGQPSGVGTAPGGGGMGPRPGVPAAGLPPIMQGQ